MLSFNPTDFGGGFRDQQDVILTEIRERLAHINQLVERIAPKAGFQQGPAGLVGAGPNQLSKESVEALSRLRAEADALRARLDALVADGTADSGQ